MNTFILVSNWFNSARKIRHTEMQVVNKKEKQAKIRRKLQKKKSP